MKTPVYILLPLILVSAANGQWQRMTSYQQRKENRPELQCAHSLKWFLAASPARIIEDVNGQDVSLQDSSATATQQLIGQSFGRKIFQIVLFLAPQERQGRGTR